LPKESAYEKLKKSQTNSNNMKKHTTSHELAEPVENLVEDAKELMSATAHVAEEKVVEARRRLAAAVDRAKDAWNTVQESAVAKAKATDQVIRTHPYQSIGIAFGVGAILGFLISRRSK
jgi:ElaB/YqjD/DUF883 family membrane-anchored ribosome-binding protein